MMRQEQRLQIVYWIGAAVDGLAGLALLFPGRLFALLGLAADTFSPVARAGLNLGATLLMGWAVLLLWGGQRPVARRGLLTLTVLVELGLALVAASAAESGVLTTLQAVVTWAILLILSVLFLWGYSRAGRSMMFR